MSKKKKKKKTVGEKVFARDAELDAQAALRQRPVDIPMGGTASEIQGAPAGSPGDLNPVLPNPEPLLERVATPPPAYVFGIPVVPVVPEKPPVDPKPSTSFGKTEK